MLQKKSKPIDSSWAAVLQAELSGASTEFPPDALTIDELRQQRKKAGLPSGRDTTYRWVQELARAGKVAVHTGVVRNATNRLVQAVRYSIKS